MDFQYLDAFSLSGNTWTDKLGKVVITDYQSHYSSDGNLEKWRIECLDGKVYWLKSSSTDRLGNIMYECESECIASRIAIALGMPNVVQYSMDVLHIGNSSIKVCCSEEFNELDIVYYADVLPNVVRLTGQEKYEAVNSLYPALEEDLQSVLLFDILIGNSDRHLHNLALDLDKSEFLVFDNGASMLSASPTDNLKIDLKVSFGYHRCRPFYDTVAKQIQLIDRYYFNPISQQWLCAMVDNFLPKRRAKLIKNYLVANFTKVGEHFEFSVFKK